MGRIGWLALALFAVGAPEIASFEAPAVAADAPSADDILAKVDANMVADSRSNLVKMTQMKNGRPREFLMQVHAKGNDKAAIETMEPVRNKGERYLRMGDEMWIYFPSTETTQKISGHMLRNNLNGSDVSYEDMISSKHLREEYPAKILGNEQVVGHDCYKLELIAKDSSVAYPKRIAWVDSTTFIPLKQEMYALSGLLLKTWDMSNVQDFAGRKYPTTMVISDKVQEGSTTTLSMSNLQFGVAIDDGTFTTGWLERK
jgi:outer membrane lipoprotein-sorting protein